tara:strand:- start:3353 stop:3709 length:357 start_codon:yes stop_codon:yes gene_type:complete
MSKPESFDPKAFRLSNAAVNHFKNIFPKEGASKGIRFSVEEASGCSGYTYAMDFVREIADEDIMFDCQDLRVYIDPNSFNYLKGTTVDFVKEGVNEEVKFLNPNVKAVCGCGESFEID